MYFTILISLKRAKSRRRAAIEALKKSKISNWCTIDAVDGLKIHDDPVEYNESKVNRLLGFSLTRSEIGCFLSHRQAWIACIKEDKPTLVLEDDFHFEDNFDMALSILNDFHYDWGIVRLQGLVSSSHTILFSKSNHQIVINNEDPLGATGYIIKPHAAKFLVQHSNFIFEPLDHFLEHYKKHNVRIIAIKPYPISSNGEISTINDRFNRFPIRGHKKMLRSLYRFFDRLLSKNPLFPN